MSRLTKHACIIGGSKAYYLLASVLQVAHERLLHAVELGKLHADGLACPLQVLRALGKVLAALYAGGRHGECSL